MTSRSQRSIIGLVVAVIAALVTWYAASGGSPTTTPFGDGVDPVSGLAWIAESELPSEALDTLKDIDNGGPYAYPGRDDSIFTNREGLLPDHESGYYREYTVITPGSDDRGARRIVRGDADEFYYTDDHYESFRRIAR